MTREVRCDAAGQVLARDRLRRVGDIVQRARRDDVTAMNAGSRSDIDNPVGGTHHIFVVLDDDQGVANIAETLQRLIRRWLSR